MRTAVLLLWAAVVALGVWQITRATPPGRSGAGPARVDGPCTARKAMPKNHRLADGELDCDRGAPVAYAGQYLASAVTAGTRLALDGLLPQPLVAANDGEEVFLLPLNGHGAAAGMLDAGMRLDVWCGGSSPRIDAAQALAVLCPSPASAPADCQAVLSVPRGLRGSLTALTGCQIVMRPPASED
jgi:hypothetical protein